jgi:hypothetical protein
VSYDGVIAFGVRQWFEYSIFKDGTFHDDLGIHLTVDVVAKLVCDTNSTLTRLTHVRNCRIWCTVHGWEPATGFGGDKLSLPSGPAESQPVIHDKTMAIEVAKGILPGNE